MLVPCSHIGAVIRSRRGGDEQPTVRPSNLAVSWLITNSNVLDFRACRLAPQPTYRDALAPHRYGCCLICQKEANSDEVLNADVCTFGKDARCRRERMESERVA
jgi:hypothetical protein